MTGKGRGKDKPDKKTGRGPTGQDQLAEAAEVLRKTARRTTKKKGRPPIDPNAPAPPTLSIARACKRYGLGRDQMMLAVKLGEVPSITICGKPKVVTSRADAHFGL
jgi:hypothetical protein